MSYKSGIATDAIHAELAAIRKASEAE